MCTRFGGIVHVKWEGGLIRGWAPTDQAPGQQLYRLRLELYICARARALIRYVRSRQTTNARSLLLQSR